MCTMIEQKHTKRLRNQFYVEQRNIPIISNHMLTLKESC